MEDLRAALAEAFARAGNPRAEAALAELALSALGTMNGVLAADLVALSGALGAHDAALVGGYQDELY